jgi:hypothetical protein
MIKLDNERKERNKRKGKHEDMKKKKATGSSP